jgi:iron complex outermembrane recepter protein
MAMFRRPAALGFSTAIAVVATAWAASAASAQEPVHVFDVKAQAADKGLVRFAQQAGIQILAPTTATRHRQIDGIEGQFTVEEGLRRLVAQSRLRLVSFNGRTAVLADSASPPLSAAAPAGFRTVAYQPGAPAAAASPEPAAAAPAAPEEPQPAATPAQEIIVTGNTSGKRTLFNSSSDVTLASAADLQRKAARSTAETLELVPGIFVEGTAGPVSNNYSVRGLSGGGQSFITLEEDGLPIIYQGGGADEYFQNDITIDRVEAVEGGTSGILAPNGAGATINFISLKPNFDKTEARVRFTGTTYGDYRADAYFSAPITDSLAFNIGGYVDSNKGVRRNPFAYNTYHVKAMLEKKFDDGGYVRLTVKRGDEHDPYYADMPFQVGSNGKINSVPGLNLLTDDIGGNAFANILVPDSCATGHCLRPFSLKTGLHIKTQQYRIDAEKPITEGLTGFIHARYLKASFDFNGIFPGSTGNTPFSASTYLDPNSAANPVAKLENQALNDPRFAGTTQFGIRDTQGGAIIPASNTAALSALNGNGLLQETVLNHALTKRQDFGSDFGVKWDHQSGVIDNSLTVGGMVYRTHQYNDQSGVTTVVNDVRNNSHIYDIVALNAAGGVIGQLTNNGMVSYGNWGQSVFKEDITSISGYFNDELKIGDKLHIDFGARYENQHDSIHVGNAFVPNPTVPAGTPGIITDLGPSFNGSYSHYSQTFHDWAYTAGVNYALTRNISLYARYARGFQTNGAGTGTADGTGFGTATFNKPTNLTLYEGGIRGQAHGFSGSVVAFRTLFNNQSYSFNNPDNPADTVNAVADDKIWGVQIDADWKPVHFFSLDVNGVYQEPTLTNLQFNGVARPEYSGNVPERTPKKLLTVTPSFILPNGLGEIYGRWKYIGKIFADAGDGVALPSYSVFTVGASLNVSQRFNVGVSVDNLTNAKGFTEGNPRQGQTQSIVNGYFYGRAIYGRNAMVTGTLKL